MIRAIARFSVGNSVVVNLGTLTVVVAGLLAYFAMPREVFPEFSMGTVTVTTVYPGAAPVDVERLITLPLEEELEGIDDRREMTSQSQEGISIVTLTAEPGADMRRFVEDVRTASQSGDFELPEASEDPRVREIRSEFPAIAVFVYGHASDDDLRQLAERHKRELERIPGVARVIMQGAREPRIWIEVDPAAMARYGLTLDEIGRLVGARSGDAPLGSLSTQSGDYLLRVDAEVRRAEDLRDAFVVRRPDGSGVRLSQVARVLDAHERLTTRARFNGRPCMYLQVNKRARGDAIAISKAVYAYVDEQQTLLPEGVAMGTNSDLSVYIKNRLRTMQESAFIGGVLVLIALLLFLNARVALMTALGIPISFLGGLLLAHAMGITMNMMTMFALIVVLGMVVDDAIVVGENVYRLMEEGLSPRDAAIQGTLEVGKPVMATILTTIAAFLPTMLIGGTMGEFMRPLPLIVSFCLIASLGEALIVLPSHLAHWSRPVRATNGAEPSTHWYEPMRGAYVGLLEVALRWRYVTLALVGAGTFLLIGFAVKQVPFVLFDDFESKVFSVNVRTVPGTSIEGTDRVTTALEQRVAELPEHELESTNMVVGVSYVDASRYTVGQNLAQVWVELREGTEGRRLTSEIIEDLRERLQGSAPEVESLDISQPQAGPAGRAIDIAIRGPDLELLAELADGLKRELVSFRGVRDVHDNAQPGKREVRLRLSEAGRLLGFDEDRLARELRAAFEGTRFARVRRGKDDVEIIVKLPEELREERGRLAELRVGLPASLAASEGATPLVTPLGMLAHIDETTGPSVISRDDGERSIRVLADVNKEEGNAAAITEAIQAAYADLGERHPGYSLEFKGEHQDTSESFEGLQISLLLALFLIYMILGGLFGSFGQPFVIMSAIPFGVVGMILGHMLMGRALSFMSLIGLVALTGIVVNDSLILMDFVNSRRRQGHGLMQALVIAGRQRFRPILLTSITTMVGISPLTFFASGQARFLQPMAITIFFGLAGSTLLILVAIPCTYAVLEDLMLVARRPKLLWQHLRRNETVPDELRPNPSASTR